MKLRLDRTKMAMAGNVYCYDVAVPISEVNRDSINYLIVRNHQEYCLLEDATRPAELDQMPRSFARYDAFMDHSRACKQWAWKVLQAHFPELHGVDERHFVEFPEPIGGHATLEVTA